MRLHDSGADASFCISFAPVANCIFTVWVPRCEENCRCPEVRNPLCSRCWNGSSEHKSHRQAILTCSNNQVQAERRLVYVKVVLDVVKQIEPELV